MQCLGLYFVSLVYRGRPGSPGRQHGIRRQRRRRMVHRLSAQMHHAQVQRAGCQHPGQRWTVPPDRGSRVPAQVARPRQQRKQGQR